jgi:hypothetical protein
VEAIVPRTSFTWEEILILVKAYPTPSKKHIESSCTAGITRSREWLRLHPLPYRMLMLDQRFKKYQWIRAKIKKSSDPRPESHTIDIDSIEILNERLPTERGWAQRRAVLESLQRKSLEEIWREQERTGASLGFFRPKQIESLIIEPTSSNWTPAQQAALQQQNFFDQGAPLLDKIPYDFKYRFWCDDPGCKGHEQKIVDWEIYQSYRRWQKEYGKGWEEKLRQRYEHEMQQRYDTHFFAGTMREHPNSWIIIGLFYPPKTKSQQGVLF